MKRKVGDTVTIRKDLKVDKMYGECPFVRSMMNYLGKEAKIEDIGNISYALNIGNKYWLWTDEMFEDKPVKVNKYTRGKLLTFKEILNLDGQDVYLHPIQNDKEDEGQAKVEVSDIKIKFYPSNGRQPWIAFDMDISNGEWLDVYELIENEPIESNKYEIGQKVNKEQAVEILKNGGKIKFKFGTEIYIYHIKENKLWFILNGIDNRSSGYSNLDDVNLTVYKLPQQVINLDNTDIKYTLPNGDTLKINIDSKDIPTDKIESIGLEVKLDSGEVVKLNFAAEPIKEEVKPKPVIVKKEYDKALHTWISSFGYDSHIKIRGKRTTVTLINQNIKASVYCNENDKYTEEDGVELAFRKALVKLNQREYDTFIKELEDKNSQH